MRPHVAVLRMRSDGAVVSPHAAPPPARSLFLQIGRNRQFDRVTCNFAVVISIATPPYRLFGVGQIVRALAQFVDLDQSIDLLVRSRDFPAT